MGTKAAAHAFYIDAPLVGSFSPFNFPRVLTRQDKRARGLSQGSWRASTKRLNKTGADSQMRRSSYSQKG